MKITHLIPSLHPTGASRQLTTLVQGLPPGSFAVQVLVLNQTRTSVHLESLRQAGASVQVLGKTRRLEPISLWNLRRTLGSFQPDVIHAWGELSLRWLALAAGAFPAPVVAANILSAPVKKSRPGFMDRWLLNRTACLVARGRAEADRYLQAGIPAGKIDLIPPAVAPAATRSGRDHVPLPAGTGRFILCAGFMESHKGFRDAIWAFDILTFLFPDLRLVLAGDGPDRANLERFTRAIRLEDQVCFLGACDDLAPLLARAEMVWVPSLADCGQYIALEALAAGKPVVASNLPGLREIIGDGVTGFLIPPGDKLALARRSCELLRDPDLVRRLGEAGRRAVQTFTPSQLVTRFAALYARLAA